jgi:hypothetical protein
LPSVENIYNLGDCARGEDNVGIYKKQDFPPGMEGAEVPGGSRPGVPLEFQDSHSHAGRNCGGFIGRCIVNDDDLRVAILGRRLHRGETLREIPRIVVNRYDD